MAYIRKDFRSTVYKVWGSGFRGRVQGLGFKI